jgi:hypothetical protein
MILGCSQHLKHCTSVSKAIVDEVLVTKASQRDLEVTLITIPGRLSQAT